MVGGGGGRKDGWVGDVIHIVFLGKAQTLLIQDCNRVQLYLQVTQTYLNSVNKFEIHLLWFFVTHLSNFIHNYDTNPTQEHNFIDGRPRLMK